MRMNNAKSAPFVNGPNLQHPNKDPLVSIPVGRLQQMVAVDILDVSVSSNNRYLLATQDYFTKWADARPIPDQTTVRITDRLIHREF